MTFTLYRDHPFPKGTDLQNVHVPKGSWLGLKFQNEAGLKACPIEYNWVHVKQEWINPLEFKLHAVESFTLYRQDGGTLIERSLNEQHK